MLHALTTYNASLRERLEGSACVFQPKLQLTQQNIGQTQMITIQYRSKGILMNNQDQVLNIQPKLQLTQQNIRQTQMITI